MTFPIYQVVNAMSAAETMARRLKGILMSYCRFSCNDYQSDVYVYEGSDGVVIHVAASRFIVTEQLPDPVIVDDPADKEAIGRWLDRNRIVNEVMDRSEREFIGLPHDGEDFCLQTLEEAADKLEELAEMGYRVPAGAIEEIRQDALQNTDEISNE